MDGSLPLFDKNYKIIRKWTVTEHDGSGLVYSAIDHCSRFEA